MTIKVTLTEEECFGLATQVALTVADAHINTGQAIDVLCSALAKVLGANDLSLEAIQAVSAQTLPKKIAGYARLYREQGLRYRRP